AAGVSAPARKTSQELRVSSGKRTGVMRPGSCLVVERPGLEAAVQDADEPVGDLAQGGVVVGAAGSLLVVVGAGAGRDGDRDGCLGHEGVDEPVVVDEPGGDDRLLARGAGE